MHYTLEGTFLESCDCTVICPCWVDDDPVGGHCTGFILWRIDQGQVAGLDVSGCQVVSVSSHSGKRRDSATVSVLYVDPGDREDEADQIVGTLGGAFGGDIGGILTELREVTGETIGPYRARITCVTDGAGSGTSWRVQVHEHLTNGDSALRIEATGHPSVFDRSEVEDRQGAPAPPLILQHTALSHELQTQGPVEAQQGDRLTVRVGGLPGGNLDVSGRSAMRGSFRYEEPAPARVASQPAVSAHPARP